MADQPHEVGDSVPGPFRSSIDPVLTQPLSPSLRVLITDVSGVSSAHHSQETIMLETQSPLQNLQSPLQSLQSPLQSLQSPLQSLQSPLQSLQSPLQSLQSPLQSLQSPLQNEQCSQPSSSVDLPHSTILNIGEPIEGDYGASSARGSREALGPDAQRCLHSPKSPLKKEQSPSSADSIQPHYHGLNIETPIQSNLLGYESRFAKDGQLYSASLPHSASDQEMRRPPDPTVQQLSSRSSLMHTVSDQAVRRPTDLAAVQQLSAASASISEQRSELSSEEFSFVNTVSDLTSIEYASDRCHSDELANFDLPRTPGATPLDPKYRDIRIRNAYCKGGIKEERRLKTPDTLAATGDKLAKSLERRQAVLARRRAEQSHTPTQASDDALSSDMLSCESLDFDSGGLLHHPGPSTSQQKSDTRVDVSPSGQAKVVFHKNTRSRMIEDIYPMTRMLGVVSVYLVFYCVLTVILIEILKHLKAFKK